MVRCKNLVISWVFVLSLNLFLYYQGGTVEGEEMAAKAASIFGKRLDIRLHPEDHPPPPEAWDNLGGFYDAHALIELMQIPEGFDLALWVVAGEIGDAWHPYLFGAAGDRRAIVSTARLSSKEDLLKEICHEIGHLLGLKHCRRACIMRRSFNESQVNKKPLAFCPSCSAELFSLLSKAGLRR